jgi:hypothetical protein
VTICVGADFKHVSSKPFLFTCNQNKLAASQPASHQHALLCINKKCCFGINVLKLPRVGSKIFAKREIQIQKVSDYVGFQSPQLNSRNFVLVKLPDFYIGFSVCSQIYKDD